MGMKKIVYIAILIMLLSGCTRGGEQPPETTPAATTVAPATEAPTTTPLPTTAAPTTTSPPATTAPPAAPAVDLNDPSVQIEKVVPAGGSVGVFPEVEYKNLNFQPLKYREVSAYKITYPGGLKIYVMKSQSEAASKDFYTVSIEQIRSIGHQIKPYPNTKVLYAGEKSLEVQHRFSNEGQYWATLTQRGLYTFYLDFKAEEEAENYLKEDMAYLFK